MEDRKIVRYFVKHYAEHLTFEKWLQIPKKNRLEIIQGDIKHFQYHQIKLQI